jgi:hypothetical protein
MEKLKIPPRLKSALDYAIKPSRYLDDAMGPIRDDFAHVRTLEGFDWQRIGRGVRRTEPLGIKSSEKYLVVFRSRRKEDANIDQLVALEDAAYEDATKSGKLIAYKAGPIREDRRNVSFCIWRSAKDAYEVSHRPPHDGTEGAMAYAKQAYEVNDYEAERYRMNTRRTWRGLKTTLTKVEGNHAAPESDLAA